MDQAFSHFCADPTIQAMQDAADPVMNAIKDLAQYARQHGLTLADEVLTDILLRLHCRPLRTADRF